MTSRLPASISSLVVGSAGRANSLPDDASSLGRVGDSRAARSNGGGWSGAAGRSVAEGLSREDGGVQVGTERQISPRASEAAERVSYDFDRR